MALSHNTQLTSPATYVAGETGSAVRTHLNDANTTLVSNDDTVMAATEDANDDLHSKGIISGSFSAGTGLQVDNTALVVHIGKRISIAAGSTPVQASKTNSPIYIGNDGSIYVDSPPTSKDYFQAASYTSDGSSVTSVNTNPSGNYTERQLLCYIQVLSGAAQSSLLDAGDTEDIIIDHSSLGRMPIWGKVVLTITEGSGTIVPISAELWDDTTFRIRITASTYNSQIIKYTWKRYGLLNG